MRRKIIKFLILLLILVGVSGWGAWQYTISRLEQPINLSTARLLTIQAGQSAGKVLADLYAQGIIGDPRYFKVYFKAKPEQANFKAGTYELLPNMSGIALLSLLHSGKEKLFAIQLVEGLRWQDWQRQLANHPQLVSDAASQQTIEQLAADLPGQTLEGWLLPDTYYFPKATPVQTIVIHAYDKMRDFIEANWPLRSLELAFDTPYEALILASIIEKETGVASERARIAAVFNNRLRLNMRLQTDPTVIYGLGEAFDGDIKRKDLRAPNPYNTYLNKGLPPTPIAMPSKLAILAALNPDSSDELYFVAKGDGSHVFSKDLDQHNQAVRQYQLKK
jgi:UPF0755 protein